MKLTLAPENLLERIALAFNLAPTPMIDTQIAFTAARAIMAATETGVFEALGKERRTAGQVAAICRLHAEATQHLLDCLTGLGYITWHDGTYQLKKKYRKWMLKESPSNITGKMRFQLMEWDYVGQLENYLRSGQPLELHSGNDPKQWEAYQEGMRDVAVNAAAELAKKLKLPQAATAMLDIGGSHGLYSIELCKKYPDLSSTILELPDAIPHASAIASRYGLGDRVRYKAGNVLTDDLGENQYDLVIINSVVHHFTEAENAAVTRKIARALKPGGLYAIGDVIRRHHPGEGGAVASTLGLYFSLTSASGNWSEEEMKGWQREAGLKPLMSIGLMTLPGFKSVVATRSS